MVGERLEHAPTVPPWAAEETISDRTGFEHAVADPLPVTPPPGTDYVRAIRTIDADGLRERLVG